MIKQPMQNRLTDDEWQDMLGSKQVARPEWLHSVAA